MDRISVVVPCYNEQEAVPVFYNEISRVADSMPETEFQFLFIDDGSTDRTLDEIKGLASLDSKVTYVSFSRNFGKEAGMYAGLSYADGDYVVIMDVDLQDPPALLPKMYEFLASGEYDCVATRRVDRKGEPAVRSFFARMFYGLMRRISRTEIVDGARDFRMMTRQYVDEILRLSEYNRFSKGLFGWVGFRTKWLEYENVERVAGRTKWSFWRLLIYSIDGIVGFSTAPLAAAGVFGLILCIVAFFAICFIIIRKLLFGDPVAGWASMTCIIIFIGGVQMLFTGIMGEYLAKTYLETKNRPIFICRETNVRPRAEECEGASKGTVQNSSAEEGL